MSNNILIISNTALSSSESNGRILSLLIEGKRPLAVHNYCLGGVLDKKNANYLMMNDIRNIKSIFTFGHVKPDTNTVCCSGDSNNAPVKRKKAIHYFIRNILYSMNCHTTRYLKRYIIDNDINEIFLFGADAPYMYRLARVLSKKCDIHLEIYTCENYPLKDYNYIENGCHNNNLFFKLLIKSLRKQTRKAYLQACKATFNSELLLNDYKKIYNLNYPTVRYLPSVLEKVDYVARDIKHIVYGGNLYSDRVNSLLDVSEVLLNINKDVVIDVYGKASDEDFVRLRGALNIQYHGVVEYSQMIEIYKKADMLLHADGFSEYSIKDFRHAFSTKISDCYMLGIPFFIYSPKEIASTQYAFKMNSDYTATSKDDLSIKLNKIINEQLPYSVNYKKIRKDFFL